MPVTEAVVVLIVGFRNAGDIRNCVRALAETAGAPGFEVFIAENGGPAAMDELIRALSGDGNPCRLAADDAVATDPRVVRRRQRLQWNRPDGSLRMWISIAETWENLGYAGGVNAWLRPLLGVPGWHGAWILNPDAEPAPRALAELVALAATRRKGMVGSRLLPHADSPRIHSRGLAWRKLIAKTAAVDHHAPCAQPVDLDDVERRLDAPSGASLFVTRAMIEAIGLMDERYFLYFEDLEWGLRAKRLGGVGYAHASVVPHVGGSTTRIQNKRRDPSDLSVYLEFRNRIVFVRSRCPAWLPWTVFMQVLHALSLARPRGFRRLSPAMRGLLAGIRGEVGRPDRMLAASHYLPLDRPVGNGGRTDNPPRPTRAAMAGGPLSAAELLTHEPDRSSGGVRSRPAERHDRRGRPGG
jgi:N-acetylglucosaminyl-diphospho-decaprenol L-rhamnosyltransferase